MRAGCVVKISTANEITKHYFDDKDFDYEAQKIQELIGCKWIERVSLSNHIMVVDEEGLLNEKEYNPIASSLYGGTIAGNALLMTEMMTEDGLDFAGYTEEEADSLIKLIES